MPAGLTSIIFVASLALAPSDSATADPVADETRELFDEAATQYQTSDYNGAVETFTAAYRRSFAIEDEDLRGLVQAAILFNLARVHVKAYELDAKSEHLLQAVDLLEKYLGQTADLSDELDAAELLAEAEAELDRLAQLEAEQEAEAEPAEVAPSGEDELRSRKPGLVAGGYVALGLGIAGGGVSIAGAVLAGQAEADYIAGPTRAERSAAQTKGANANTMIIAGAATAGVLIATGIALIVAGRDKSRISPTAWATPTSSGVALVGSF